jgi:general secretion pathway protein E
VPARKGKTPYGALAINATDKNNITIEDPVGDPAARDHREVNLKISPPRRRARSVCVWIERILRARSRRNRGVTSGLLTGHLVFSTLHTNDAASAITRLVDMGVEPFLVASSLVAVLAQRLVRVLCKDCRVAYEATREELAEIGVRPPDRPVKIYRSEGCAGAITPATARLGIFWSTTRSARWWPRTSASDDRDRRPRRGPPSPPMAPARCLTLTGRRGCATRKRRRRAQI